MYLCNGGDRKNWLMYASVNWRSMFHKTNKQAVWFHYLLLLLYYIFFFSAQFTPITYRQVQPFSLWPPHKVTINLENLWFYTSLLFLTMSPICITCSIARFPQTVYINVCVTLCGNAVNDMHFFSVYFFQYGSSISTAVYKRVTLQTLKP